ncbi:hypothetical protein GO986_14120 [Deinococcus sp. HMF7620]|uniref:Streptogramin lyase n=1 Tax=Deinococcus arboris TaxID=2682977 RepID=A0A7C9HSK6_9DEIO|nr:hypothetical protein [Deinococcus arboris]MVN87894.1 hypothetical protein [Deinococcus arboris]
MKRRLTSLSAALLLGTALLVACGSSAPGSSAQPVAGGVTALTEQLPVSGDAPSSGRLRLSRVAPAALRVTVDSTPAGVTVTPGPPVVDGPDSLVALAVTGRGTGLVTLSVSVGGSPAARVTVPLAQLQLQSLGGAAPYVAAAGVAAPGGVLLRAPANAEEERRHSLRLVAGQTVTPLSFALQGFEAITSHATRGAEVWVAVRGVTSAGSFLLRREANGQVTRFAAGTTDTLNHLTPAPDGRVWFTAYGQAALLSLDPVSGTVRRQEVEGGLPETLVSAPDGTLYYTRRGAAPAVVAFSPVTGQTRAYPVGTANVSVPEALHAAPDGTLWFTETRTGAVWNLDPRSGAQRSLTLPAGTRPSALAVTASGTLWVADQSRATLLRVPAGASSGALFPVPAVAPAGPRALTVTPDGALWFESGGQLAKVLDGG